MKLVPVKKLPRYQSVGPPVIRVEWVVNAVASTYFAVNRSFWSYNSNPLTPSFHDWKGYK